tara:strand:- start:1971 stop:2171 length:201 start_codon:yes stop_codon:yes gene_type:complete
MTVVELASACGLTLAGIAGLIKASNCRRVECGIRGLVCEKELVRIPSGKSDFDIASNGKEPASDLS